MAIIKNSFLPGGKKPSQKERRLWGNPITKRQRLSHLGQDDEEKGVSKGRTASCKFGGCPSVPLRARTQSTNMRVTAKQKG